MEKEIYLLRRFSWYLLLTMISHSLWSRQSSSSGLVSWMNMGLMVAEDCCVWLCAPLPNSFTRFCSVTAQGGWDKRPCFTQIFGWLWILPLLASCNLCSWVPRRLSPDLSQESLIPLSLCCARWSPSEKISIQVFLSMASFTWHDASEIHPCCCVYHYCLPSYCWLGFHDKDIT